MFTEDYVSLEMAKLLKEKGFEVPSFKPEEWAFCMYDEEGKLRWGCYSDDWYCRVTLQMAMKWLREVHNIHINLDVHWLYFANALGWMYTIEKILENGVDYVCSDGDENDKPSFYSTYEQACEAAIKYCLENLI